ncbi:hypothetical protein UY3_12744 [Chelonia mydas]|uniref:Uncharacterized protein n=1 Tax=Chelonia mydas TaxID=8469 RepID=M7BDA9_CHEMY|nr:hypothetical protein UY3_12744 [Chelonia mydas]
MASTTKLPLMLGAPGDKTLQVHVDQGEQPAGPPVSAMEPAVRGEAITEPSHEIPQNDAKAPQELLKRVTSKLGLQAEELEEQADSLFNVLPSTAPARVAFPLHKGVLKISSA